MVQNIKIGTRGSKLAITQANHVRDLLVQYGEQRQYKYHIDFSIIKTTGDKITDKPLYDIGGKALFVKEIEEAMLMNQIDLAVHSMKDIPAFYPADLGFYAYLEREDSRDAFISVNYTDIMSLPENAKIGTSAVRRIIQLKYLRPDLSIYPLRGNVDSRLAKLHAGEFDAIILAVAGLKRLNIPKESYNILCHTSMLPAIGQGVIGIECKNDRYDIRKILNGINHMQTAQIIQIERSFQIEINGNCRTPMAAHTVIDNNRVDMQFLYGSEDLEHIVKIFHTSKIENAEIDAIKCAIKCKKLIEDKFSGNVNLD